MHDMTVTWPRPEGGTGSGVRTAVHALEVLVSS